MNSINNIEISIEDFNSMNINIVPNVLKVYVKDQEKNIDVETIEKILNIICKWEKEYINNRFLDAPTCRVKIVTNTGIDEYYMRGDYPKTYDEFHRIVSDIYG